MARYRNVRTGVVVLVSDEQAQALNAGYVPADEPTDGDAEEATEETTEAEPKKLTAAQKKAQAKSEPEESSDEE